MIGIKLNVKVVKFKVVLLLKIVFIDIMYGIGIFRSGEVFDFLVEFNLVNKSGVWYNIGEEKFG